MVSLPRTTTGRACSRPSLGAAEAGVIDYSMKDIPDPSRWNTDSSQRGFLASQWAPLLLPSRHIRNCLQIAERSAEWDGKLWTDDLHASLHCAANMSAHLVT